VAGAEAVEGVVVGVTDFGEAHRVVRLLSAARGRVAVMARGARRSKKRFAGLLDLGTRLRVQLGRGRGSLPVIAEADRLGGPRRARDGLERIALLAYGCELCGALAAEGEPAPKLHRLLEVWLELLEGPAEPGWASVVALEAKALTFAGIAPALTHCCSCGEPLDDPVVFDAASGGGHHARCGGGRATSAARLARLEVLRRTPLHDTVDPAHAVEGPSPLLWAALTAHLGRAPRSRALVDDVL